MRMVGRAPSAPSGDHKMPGTFSSSTRRSKRRSTTPLPRASSTNSTRTSGCEYGQTVRGEYSQTVPDPRGSGSGEDDGERPVLEPVALRVGAEARGEPGEEVVERGVDGRAADPGREEVVAQARL